MWHCLEVARDIAVGPVVDERAHLGVPRNTPVVTETATSIVVGGVAFIVISIAIGCESAGFIGIGNIAGNGIVSTAGISTELDAIAIPSATIAVGNVIFDDVSRANPGVNAIIGISKNGIVMDVGIGHAGDSDVNTIRVRGRQGVVIHLVITNFVIQGGSRDSDTCIVVVEDLIIQYFII